MTLTLHDIKVWNTGEVIDLVVPSDTDASVDASAMTIAPDSKTPTCISAIPDRPTRSP